MDQERKTTKILEPVEKKKNKTKNKKQKTKNKRNKENLHTYMKRKPITVGGRTTT